MAAKFSTVAAHTKRVSLGRHHCTSAMDLSVTCEAANSRTTFTCWSFMADDLGSSADEYFVEPIKRASQACENCR